MTAARPPRRVRAAFFWAPFAVFALLGMLWSLASPVFSVPDENAHALKAIAQVRGQVIGYTLPDVKHIVVDLPPGYEYHPNILCFATYPERTADCGVELGDASGQDWFNTWVGAYNPVYYYLVGWPSLLFEGSAGIYAMRIASSLLGAALLAWAFLAAASGRRSRWMPLGIAFAAAPMSMYLIGAVNPNGAEIAAAVAVWAGVLRLLETFGDEEDRPWLSRAALWVGVTAASVMLVNARALGPLWLVVVVGLCLVASGWTAVKRLFTTGSPRRLAEPASSTAMRPSTAMRIASSLLGSAFLAFAFRARHGRPPGAMDAARPRLRRGADEPVPPRVGQSERAELAASVALWVGAAPALRALRPAGLDAARIRGPVSRTATWAHRDRRRDRARQRPGARAPLARRRRGARLAGGRMGRRASPLHDAEQLRVARGDRGRRRLFSLGWTLSGGSLSNQADVGDAPLVGGTFLAGRSRTCIRTTPDYLQQAIGFFGWLDTPLPVWTYWFSSRRSP